MARALVRTNTAKENVRDFQYVDDSSILLPASSILIGTGGTLNDSSLYTAADLTFTFANGTGDNGLDTGPEFGDQWYFLYAVPKTSTTYILKASIQPPPQAGGTGPTGFTQYRYLGLFKNGTNMYDATNGSFGRGDIVRFTKDKNLFMFVSINSTNAGVFPSASGTQGLCLSTGNSSTNGIVFDGANAGYWGTSGANPNGNGVKLPYRRATYIFEGQANSTAANSYIRMTDSASNDRQYIPWPALVSLLRSPQFLYTVLPNAATVTWSEVIQFVISGNPNVSRFLMCSGMYDPYILGGN